MSRDVNGNYTLPSGNPVVPGTIIASTWANPTMDDIAQALTDSLDRYGRGGMVAALPFPDGTVGAPTFTWTNEPNTGLYRAGGQDMRATVDGADVFRFIAGDAQVFKSAQWRGLAVPSLDNGFTAFQTFEAGALLKGTTTMQGVAVFDGATAHFVAAATFDSSVGVTGLITASGGVSGTSGSFSTTLGVTGAVTFGGTLGLTGAATFGSSLGVTGLGTFGTLKSNGTNAADAGTTGNTGFLLGTESVLRRMSDGNVGIGNTAHLSIVYSATNPYWNNGSATQTFAMQNWVTANFAPIGGSAVSHIVAGGWVLFNGTVTSGGFGGFAVTKGGTGVYNLTFPKSANNTGGEYAILTISQGPSGGGTVCIAYVQDLQATGTAIVHTVSLAGVATDCSFGVHVAYITP